MRFKINIVLIILLTGVCTGLAIAGPTDFSGKKLKALENIAESPKTFEVGEHLDFDVSWMGIPVGLGSLEVKEKVRVNGRPAYHVIAIAETNDFLSVIYPVHDEIHSYIDAEKFCSLEFRKQLSEGNYKADERMVYDYPKKKAFYESLLNKTKKEFDLPGPIHDFLSAFYWFRLQKVAIGKSLKTVVNSEEQNWDLELQMLRIETKELKGGVVVPTIVVEPKTKLKGILYKRGRAWVYFSTDSKRTPIWISLRTPFGPVVGVLRTQSH